MAEQVSGGDPVAPHGVDTMTPSVARVYDAFLGGKDNYESDRALVRQILQIAPEVPVWTRENRRWLGRVVEWLARSEGIDQFLDLGSGLPTGENTHEIAQRSRRSARVVYVDNDPAVIAHGRALLADNDSTTFSAADFTAPATVLEDETAVGILDLGRPVGLIMGLTAHHISDLDQARSIVADYTAALAPGSYVAISHTCNPRDGSRAARFTDELEERFRKPFPALRFRTPAEIRSLFDGLELVDPGVVRLFDWYPADADERDDDARDQLRNDAAEILYCGVARKP
jgi:hypothetical protein